MTENQSSTRPNRWFYGLLVVATAVVTYGLSALLLNISERKQEAREHFVKLAEMTEDTMDPAVWGWNFPRQYDSYRRTVDTERTRYGGSEAFSKLDDDPRWKRIFDGYAFSIDYREERGHAWMLADQDETERVHKFKQPGACLHCHASVIPAYRAAGDGDVMRGFEKVCAMPLSEARGLVEHPVSCLDCHDPQTLELRVTRPGFINAMRALARSDASYPHMPSLELWRKGPRTEEFDVNKLATRQEMRSFVCGQCHVEYYFQGTGKLVTYPWHKGLKVEEIETYYDEVQHTDWVHPDSGTSVLKAQHPEFELWNQGIHARSGVSCADCHMPYKREGAIKVSDHQVRSPMLNVSRSCQTCHHFPDEELKSRVTAIQDRTKSIMTRAEIAVVDLLDALKSANSAGVPDERLARARQLHRQAQWRLDFIAAENSMGFHASQESARILSEAIDLARQSQIEAISASRP